MRFIDLIRNLRLGTLWHGERSNLAWGEDGSPLWMSGWVGFC